MTSLMDEKYLAHLDMWIYLTLNPWCVKDDYLKLDRPFVHPVRRICYACDVAVVRQSRGHVDCDLCPLEFEEPCAEYGAWDDPPYNLWGQYRLSQNQLYAQGRHTLADKVRYHASEILMTRWRRK